MEEISKQIAVSAIKYEILKHGIGKNIIYNEKEALSFEGNSGPYIQYTAVRANSVLNKTEEKLKLSNTKIGNLEKMLVRFPEVIESALDELAPQYVVTYITELASEFNSFYSKEKISDSPHNLVITQAVFHTLKNGLDVLGIEVPEKM